MKKFILLLMLLCCVAINAQVHVGQQAGTSTNYGPVNAYYGYSYIQNIYKASDINASGEITGLTFEMENEDAIESSDDNIDVWIGHTSKESFENTDDWVDVSTLTQVLTDGSINKEGTTVTITFEAPFDYNGTDNLILVYDANEEGYDASLDKFYYSTNANEEDVTIYYRNDSTNPDPTAPPTATIASPNYPDITFLGIMQGCPAPTDLTATDITTNSAVLSWMEAGEATTWHLEYGETGFTMGEGTMMSDLDMTTYTLEELSDGTFYDFYVQAACGEDDLSTWTGPFTFNTIAENATPPYSTSFEGNMPVGWTTEVISGNEWAYHESESNAHTGTGSLRYLYNSSEAANSWAFTIGIVLEAGKDYDVSFFQRVSSATFPENLKLTVGTEANATAQTTVLLDLPEADNTDYERRGTMFTPEADGIYFFGLQAYSEADQFAILVDDFSVKEHTIFAVNETEPGDYWYSSLDWADYDMDGDADLLIAGAHPTEDAPYNAGNSTTHVYDNDGNGNLTLNESIVLQGVHAGDAKWIDYDNDGDLDIVMMGIDYATAFNMNALYENVNGTFTQVEVGQNGVSWGSISSGDYDNDGDLDVLMSGWNVDDETHGYASTYIWENQEGTLVRQDVSDTIPGVFNGSVNWVDIDNDMDLDIIISDDYTGDAGLRIYINNDGTFTLNQTVTTYAKYYNMAIGDYDNDGYMDVAVTVNDSDYNNFIEILTNNNGIFEHVTELIGSSASASATPIAWGDYDNDGDLDLAANGTDDDYKGEAILYKNEDGMFSAVENTGFLAVGGHSLAWQDVDGDLDLDILITGFYDHTEIDEYYGTSRLYKNNHDVINTAPVTPSDLSSFVEDGVVTFNWSGSHDAQTGTEGLQYHIQVGTTSGATDVAHYQVHGNQWMLKDLPADTEELFWCVKSMDTSFIMSDCSEEQMVSMMSTNDLTNNKETWQVYPNPVKNGILYLATKQLQDKDVHVQIFNLEGKLVLDKHINGADGIMEISVQDLPKGNYFLRYINAVEKGTLHVIVE